MRFLEEKFVPIAARIGSQRHLVAIRDAFVVIMPVTIVGAVAVLVNNIQGVFAENGLNVMSIYNGYTNFIQSTGIYDVMAAVNKGSINMMAVLLVAALGYEMAQGMDGDGIATAIVSLTCYLGLAPAVQTLSSTYEIPSSANSIEVVISDVLSGGIAGAKLDSNGMFVGMLLTIAVSEVFIRLSKNEKLKITLPEGVPPAVAGSFTVLIPAILAVIIVVAVGTYSAPLNSVADTIGTAILVEALVHLLWVFGLHGANIVGAVTTPIFTPMLVQNTSAFENHETIPNIVPTVANFARLGGSGATLGLVISVLLFSKVQAERTVISISTAPAIFEINEPIIFGFPIVMNPTYMLPFVLGPVIIAFLTYFLMSVNIIERGCLQIPWVTPPILTGFLITGGGFKAAIYQIVTIVIDTLLWIPFVMMSNKQNATQD